MSTNWPNHVFHAHDFRITLHDASNTAEIEVFNALQCIRIEVSVETLKKMSRRVADRLQSSATQTAGPALLA